MDEVRLKVRLSVDEVEGEDVHEREMKVQLSVHSFKLLFPFQFPLSLSLSSNSI